MMIGKRIQTYRKQKRLSLNELARRAGVAKSYLSSIERNIQSNPSIEFIRKISEVLGVKVEALIKDDLPEELTPSEREWVHLSREFKRQGISIDMVKQFVEHYSANAATMQQQM